jgi:hypothetical protein
MINEVVVPTSISRVLISVTMIGLAVLGIGSAQAQEPSATAEIEAPAQSGAEMRGIEKSDIRRGQAPVNDVDGDGHADAAQAGGAPPNDNGKDAAAQRKIKMKRLKPTEAEPLTLMDETDTCPTLPCP